MGQTHSVARIEDCGQILGYLPLVQLRNVAQPGQLVVERDVRELLQDHRQHPRHPGHRGEPLLRDGVQEIGDELDVVERSNPYWTPDMVGVLTELAVGVDRRSCGATVLDLALAQPGNEEIKALSNSTNVILIRIVILVLPVRFQCPERL